jgi:hypothetical protein
MADLVDMIVQAILAIVDVATSYGLVLDGAASSTQGVNPNP